MSSEGSLKASKVGVAGLEAEVPGSEGSEETCPQPHEGGPLAFFSPAAHQWAQLSITTPSVLGVPSNPEAAQLPCHQPGSQL